MKLNILFRNKLWFIFILIGIHNNVRYSLQHLKYSPHTYVLKTCTTMKRTFYNTTNRLKIVLTNLSVVICNIGLKINILLCFGNQKLF